MTVLRFCFAGAAARITAIGIVTALLTISCNRGSIPSGARQPDPGVRNAHALFYDPVNRAVVLFGGADEREVRHDTWAWDGRRWNFLTDRGPPGRTFAAVAVDVEGRATYLFGGNRVLFGSGSDTSTFLCDFWLWNGTEWNSLPSGVAGPSPRAEATMAFDSHRRRLVLFGGRVVDDQGSRRLGDTWEWTGQEWILMDSAGPVRRSGAAMAYDPVQRVMVLFGGSTGSASGETWIWNGVRWRQEPQIVSARFNAVMTYDPDHKRIVRFGGWLNPRRFGDSWVYRSGRWDSLALNGPAARNHAQLTYDFGRGEVVLMGGHDGGRVFGDVWALRGTRWSLVHRGAPATRLDNGH